jgi:vancomycin resistance protein VanJ
MIIETPARPRLAEPRPVEARPVVVRPTRARRPWLLAACCCYLLIVVCAWLTMRLEGDRWWVGTVLLIAPRWPFLLPLLGLGPWALFARRLWPLAILCAAGWAVIVPIMGLRVSLPAMGSERPDIRLVTCNVHRQHLDAERLTAYVAEVQPDVVTLQGWSESGHESLFVGDGWQVRREGELLVASHFPIVAVTPLDFADATNAPQGERGAAALVELQTPRGSIFLITLHLASPHAGLLSASADAGGKLADNVERRWHESDTLRALADRVAGPLLLAGDFNTTDDSPIFREHWRGFADAFSERGAGFGYTYLIGHTQIRIDHVLAGPVWRFVRCWVGPDVGSPHRPVVAEANFR